MQALRADAPTLLALGLMAAGTAGLGYVLVSQWKAGARYKTPRDDQSTFEAAGTWWIIVGSLSFLMKEGSKAASDLNVQEWIP